MTLDLPDLAAMEGLGARIAARLRPGDVVELGLDDYREGAALLAEWPEKAGGFSHEPGCLSIALEFADHGRKAVVQAGASWQSRWP